MTLAEGEVGEVDGFGVLTLAAAAGVWGVFDGRAGGPSCAVPVVGRTIVGDVGNSAGGAISGLGFNSALFRRRSL